MQPFVSIITPTKRPDKIDNIFENFLRQTYENKELIIALNNNEFDIDKWERRAREYNNIHVYKIEGESNIGAARNFCIEKSKYDYVFFFDDDDYYSEKYITHMMEVFERTGASVVGKRTAFTYFEESGELGIYAEGRENCRAVLLQDATISFKKKDVEGITFPEYSLGNEGAFLVQCRNSGLIIYSCDRFDYVTIRNRKNNHTWTAEDSHIKLMCTDLRKVDDFREYIKRPEQ